MYKYLLCLIILLCVGCRKPTAICWDGTKSYSKNNMGTCSHHGGVREWLNDNNQISYQEFNSELKDMNTPANSKSIWGDLNQLKQKADEDIQEEKQYINEYIKLYPKATKEDVSIVNALYIRNRDGVTPFSELYFESFRKDVKLRWSIGSSKSSVIKLEGQPFCIDHMLFKGDTETYWYGTEKTGASIIDFKDNKVVGFDDNGFFIFREKS